MKQAHSNTFGLAPDLRTRLLQSIERHAGLRLAPEQVNGLERAVAELLVDSPYQDPEDLTNVLVRGDDIELLDDLAARLTIGETHFFRVQPQIEAVRGSVLPDLIRRHSADRRIRIWSAGCSSGEEPYTIAILVREALPSLETWDIQIWGTDLSPAALMRARAAEYRDWSFWDTPAYVCQRYFTQLEYHWRLIESIRSMVRFARKNLVAPDLVPPGFGAFDFILCRNVTIYFSAETTQRLYRQFAGALRPGGWLMLGPSDPIPDDRTDVETVTQRGVTLWRRPETAALIPDQPAPFSRQPLPRPAPAGRSLLEKHLPRRPSLHELGPAATERKPRNHEREQIPALSLDASHHLQLGLNLLEQGNPLLAIENIRRATFVDPQHVVAHFSLGRAYFQHGDRVRARAALTHTRRLLAVLSIDEEVPSGDGLSVERFRHAVDALIGVIDRNET